MKKKVVLLLLFVLLTLCACADLKIGCGIDKENTAYLAYNITIDISALEDADKTAMEETTDTLVAAYRTRGFAERRYTVEKDIITIALEYQKAADNAQEAFANLKTILTDPQLTPFLTVDMTALEENDRYRAYTFAVTTDLSKIFSASNIKELPQSVQDRIYEGLQNSTCTLSVVLPGDEMIVGTGTAKDGFCTAEITAVLGEASVLELKTKSFIGSDAAQQAAEAKIKQLEEDTAAQRTSLYIGLGAAGLGILLLIFLLIFFRKRPKQAAATVSEMPLDTPAGHE